MGAYLAFAWEASAPGAADQAFAWGRALAAGPWSRAWTGGGLEVWTSGAQPPAVVSAADDVVLVGQLFPRRASETPQAPRGVSEGGSALAVARRLVVDHWGSYVALLGGSDRAPRWVLRDPSGAWDVLTWRRGHLSVAASEIEALPPGFLPSDLRLDWEVITDYVRRPGSVTAVSGLRGLATVAPGDLQPLGGARTDAVALWRPACWARQASAPLADAEDRLRAAVEQTVSALVDADGRHLMEVSGGLDSAIVATTLQALGVGGRVAAALNFYGDQPVGDERAWAAAVCERLGQTGRFLAKAPHRLDLEDLADLARGARPALNALDTDRDRRTVEVLQQVDAQAILTGKGGDAVFFQAPSALVLSDLIQAQGRRAACGRFAQELARRLRRSVWSVALEARRGLQRGTPAPSSPLWGPRPRAAPGGAEHPWLDDLEDVAPAKRFQISALVTTQLHRGTSRHGRAARVIHPLLAQPVMELALAIPAWQLLPRAQERGLARAAFADRLPPESLARRSKGDLASLYARTVAENLEVIRPYLLDGALVSSGLLDGPALDAALDAEVLIRRADSSAIFSAMAIEAWVRHWQGRVPDAAGGRTPP